LRSADKDEILDFLFFNNARNVPDVDINLINFNSRSENHREDLSTDDFRLRHDFNNLTP